MSVHRGEWRFQVRTEPTVEGNLVWPSLQGSTNWFSPSYSPASRLFYVAVREMGAYYYKGEAEYKPGTFFAGGGERALDGDKAFGAIRALEVETGKVRLARTLDGAALDVPAGSFAVARKGTPLVAQPLPIVVQSIVVGFSNGRLDGSQSDQLFDRRQAAHRYGRRPGTVCVWFAMSGIRSVRH